MKNQNNVSSGSNSTVATIWQSLWSGVATAAGGAASTVLNIMGLNDIGEDVVGSLDLSLGGAGGIEPSGVFEMTISNSNKGQEAENTRAINVQVHAKVPKNPSHLVLGLKTSDGQQQILSLDMRVPRGELSHQMDMVDKILAGMGVLRDVSISLANAKQVVDFTQESQGRARITEKEDEKSATTEELKSAVSAVMPVLGKRILKMIEAQEVIERTPHLTNDELLKVFQSARKNLIEIFENANSTKTLGDLRKEITTLDIQSKLEKVLSSYSEQNKEPSVEALRELNNLRKVISNTRRKATKLLEKAERDRYLEMISEAPQLLESRSSELNEPRDELKEDESKKSVQNVNVVKVKEDKKLKSASIYTQGRKDQKQKNIAKRALKQASKNSNASHEGTKSSSPTPPNTPTTENPSVRSFPTTTSLSNFSVEPDSQRATPDELREDKKQPSAISEAKMTPEQQKHIDDINQQIDDLWEAQKRMRSESNKQELIREEEAHKAAEHKKSIEEVRRQLERLLEQVKLNEPIHRDSIISSSDEEFGDLEKKIRQVILDLPGTSQNVSSKKKTTTPPVGEEMSNLLPIDKNGSNHNDLISNGSNYRDEADSEHQNENKPEHADENVDIYILAAMDAAINAVSKWVGGDKKAVLQELRNDYQDPSGIDENDLKNKDDILRRFIFTAIKARQPLPITTFGKVKEGYTASATAFYNELAKNLDGKDKVKVNKKVATVLGVVAISNQYQFAAAAAEAFEKWVSDAKQSPQGSKQG